MLDQGGTTDETINLLCKLGLTVSTSTISRKKKQVAIHHQKELEKNYTSVVKTCATTKASKQLLLELTKQDCVIDVLDVKCDGDSFTLSYKGHCLRINTQYIPASVYLPYQHLTNSNVLAACSNSTVRVPVLVNSGSVHVLSNIPAVSEPPTTSSTLPSEVSSNNSTALPSTVEALHCAKYFSKLQDDVLFEVIGDNFDLTISPNYMTSEKQRQSLHWFLYLALEKRVFGSHLPNNGPQADIATIPSTTFVPSKDEIESLESDFIYHMCKTATKNLKFLQPFASCVPQHLDHPYMAETSKKSKYTLCELIDRSENDSEGIITILDQIQRKFVPHTNNEHPKVLENIVLGGDVLTNERAYSAQQAMANGTTDYECLGGFIHRPEGLHRMMNFVLTIYQTFYKESADQGTLWQLRNLVNRKDVSGADSVTNRFRPHHTFIDDCLDAYITAACMKHFGLDDVDSTPKSFNPLVMICSDAHKYNWLRGEIKTVYESHIKNNCGVDNISSLREVLEGIDSDDLKIRNMKLGDGTYRCDECSKIYKRVKSLRKHMSALHGWQFESTETSSETSPTDSTSERMKAGFMFAALLLRNTYHAHRYGDGGRAIRNVKFECMFAGAAGHTKYRLWLWRVLAYVNAILSPRQAFEYTWNITANLNGGKGQNIANDNLVEMKVKAIKQKLRSQGANVTFDSAQTVCQSVQIIDSIKANMLDACSTRATSQSHSKPNKASDILNMIQDLLHSKYFSNQQANVHGFTNFINPLDKVKLPELDAWIREQKTRASIEM